MLTYVFFEVMALVLIVLVWRYRSVSFDLTRPPKLPLTKEEWRRRSTSIIYRIMKQPHLPKWLWRRLKRLLVRLEFPGQVRLAHRRIKELNSRVALPEGAFVHFPAIWVVELYTPSTIQNLLHATEGRQELDRPEGIGGVSIRSALKDARARRGYQVHRHIGRFSHPSQPATGLIRESWVAKDLPNDFRYVDITSISMTSSVTAFVGCFYLTDEAAERVQRVMREQTPPKVVKGPDSTGWIYADVHKAIRVAECRRAVHAAASLWMTKNYPGFFNFIGEGDELPGVDLFLVKGFEPLKGGAAGLRDFRGTLQLDGHSEIWCNDDTNLRLRFNHRTAQNGVSTHLATVASVGTTLASHYGNMSDGSHSSLVYFLNEELPSFVSRWALVSMFRRLETELMKLRDYAEAVTGRQRIVRSLRVLQDKMLAYGLEAQLLSQDVKEFSADQRSFEWNVMDFHIVPVVGSDAASTASLIDELRKVLTTDAGRVLTTEQNLHQLLASSANMSAVISNIRLQRVILALTVLSLVTAAVAAWAAIVAISEPGGSGPSQPNVPAASSPAIPQPSPSTTSTP